MRGASAAEAILIFVGAATNASRRIQMSGDANLLQLGAAFRSCCVRAIASCLAPPAGRVNRGAIAVRRRRRERARERAGRPTATAATFAPTEVREKLLGLAIRAGHTEPQHMLVVMHNV